MKLFELESGQSAVIKYIEDSCKIKNRLMELGFFAGVQIRCVRKSLFGTPVLYSIAGSTIALRRADAQKITVVQP